MSSLSTKYRKLWHELIEGRITYDEFKIKFRELSDKQLNLNLKEASHEQKSSKNTRR